MRLISGFVVSFNRDHLIETCLRSIRFVDELIVLDKSSTDQTALIAGRYADRVISVPWSPTVEETRAVALSYCQHDHIVFLDDDECFSPDAIRYLNHQLRTEEYDAYAIPCRHHILGRHDESAYYWPERHVRAFRRGHVAFASTVHGGIQVASAARTAYPDPDHGICFHNISHINASMWIDKTNRYTSLRHRAGTVEGDAANLLAEARRRFEGWLDRSGTAPSQYAQAVLLLRAVYDLVDIVKHWEQREGYDGDALFAQTCRELARGYDALEACTEIPTSGIKPG